MNKIFKIAFGLIAAAAVSCSYYDTYVNEPYDVFVVKHPSANKDGQYSQTDTLEFRDNVGSGDTFIQELRYAEDDDIIFRFKGTKNDIDADIMLQTGEHGGDIRMYCSSGHKFQEIHIDVTSERKLSNADGYVAEYKDSYEVDGTTYDYILVIDPSKVKGSVCAFNRAFLARDAGLIRLEVTDDVYLTRTK